jgi:hypothetical protein
MRLVAVRCRLVSSLQMVNRVCHYRENSLSHESSLQTTSFGVACKLFLWEQWYKKLSFDRQLLYMINKDLYCNGNSTYIPNSNNNLPKMDYPFSDIHFKTLRFAKRNNSLLNWFDIMIVTYIMTKWNETFFQLRSILELDNDRTKKGLIISFPSFLLWVVSYSILKRWNFIQILPDWICLYQEGNLYIR